jgi:hypothetical protein
MNWYTRLPEEDMGEHAIHQTGGNLVAILPKKGISENDCSDFMND